MERTVLILDDMAWALEQLAAEMRMARKWGHKKELKQMIDLGITIADDLISLLQEGTNVELGGAIFPSEDLPKTFEDCLEFIRAAVRAYKAKMDQHLEVLISGTTLQKRQEKARMKILHDTTVLQVRNRTRKCRKLFPGRWGEVNEEEFQEYMKLFS